MPFRTFSLGLLLLCAAALPACADTLPAPAPVDHKAEIEAAWQAASKTAQSGPTEIKLLDEATLKVPAGEAYVPGPEAAQIMRALGNRADGSLTGLVAGTGSDDNWLIVIHHIKDGYVRDGDAKEWEPDALLDSLKQGTVAANEERVKRGFPELEILGWVERPAYDAVNHRLVWSLSARRKGAEDSGPRTINYNTYALGRDGYFSLNLLTNTATIPHDKPLVQGLLANLAYLPGKRYEDFDSSTDKVAEYGLAALIGAVAIKKLGLLALAGAFLLKAWKVGMLAIVGIGAALRRLFRRRTDAA